jgi:hypothetical protein
LTAFGFGIWHGYAGADLGTQYREFVRARSELLSDSGLHQFGLCVGWLEGRTDARFAESYALKLDVVRVCGEYVSNGALMAAVIVLCLPYRRFDCNLVIDWGFIG